MIKIIVLLLSITLSSCAFNVSSPADGYDNLNLSADDVSLMADAVWLLAKDEPYLGKVAIAELILNRVENPYFPNSILEVISSEERFDLSAAPDRSSKKYTSCLKAVGDALKGASPTGGALYFAKSNENYKLIPTYGCGSLVFGQ